MGVLGKLSPFSRAVAVSRRADAGYPVQITLLIALSLALLFASLAWGGSLPVTSAAAHSGLWGLEVTLTATCAAQQDVQVPAGDVSIDYTACATLTAGGSGATEVVGSDVTFKAGEMIILKDQFSVAPTAGFTAEIEGTLTPFAYVQDNSPAAEKSYKAIFYLRLNSLSLAGGDRLEHFVGSSSNGLEQFRLVFKRNTNLGENRLVIEAREDNKSYASTDGSNELVLPSGWNKIEIAWKAKDVSGNGELTVSVNDGSAHLTGLDNDQSQIDHVQWGAIGGSIIATSGSMDLDDFSSWR
ncbi:MAG: hypothetical protein WBH85_16640 [Thermoanaerobaculia bacterium]